MFGLFKPRDMQGQPETKPKRRGFFSTHQKIDSGFRLTVADHLRKLTQAQPALDGVAMDDSETGYPAFKTLAGGNSNTVSDALVDWYATQGFIGHQLAGIIAQHWLINKACSMPGDDAIRRGYAVTSNDGEDIDPDAAKIIKRYDKAFKINKHMREFIRMGRIFGIRIALFKVESTDPDYYKKPFNIDGITPGSYKGIVQVDPYWTAPILDMLASSQPDSLHFYEPTFWVINGREYHRSHLIIYRHAEPVDILKPSYLYGGIPLPQQIMERVYAAERTANEAPMLAQTKRTNVWLTDMEAAMSNSAITIGKLQDWSYYRDNYGIKLGDKEGDEFQQYDTSLADLDAVIMTQYQIVAAQAGIPATKLLGTVPKGFNTTGEYEESSYHEMLESIQAHDLTPLLERHHELVLRSYVVPKMPGSADLSLEIMWHPLDSPTAKEVAETNLIEAQTGAALVASGAIDGEDERKRVATDKLSGYHELGLSDKLMMPLEPLDNGKEDDEQT